MSEQENDIKRLKLEYEIRKSNQAINDLYSPRNLVYLFMLQQRQRILAKLLTELSVPSLSQKKMLEIGCGHGDVLHELLFHRIDSESLFGIDLLNDRISQAMSRFPGVNLAAADAQNLPYPAQQFDMVLQFTVFSSILDNTIKANIAAEILRVVKPGGLILWYDFWINPLNPQTRGINKHEIRNLFPRCEFTFKRVTLAPPIARKLVPLSWTMGALLEKLLFLNTHFLVAIRPK